MQGFLVLYFRNESTYTVCYAFLPIFKYYLVLAGCLLLAFDDKDSTGKTCYEFVSNLLNSLMTLRNCMKFSGIMLFLNIGSNQEVQILPHNAS